MGGELTTAGINEASFLYDAFGGYHTELTYGGEHGLNATPKDASGTLTGATIIVLQRIIDPTATQSWHQFQDSGAPETHVPYNGVSYFSTFSTSRWLSGATLPSGLDKPHVMVVRANGTERKAWINGTLLGSGTADATVQWSKYRIGTSTYSSNCVPLTYALIIVPRALADAQITSLNAANFWQLLAPEQVNVPMAGGGGTDSPVTATDALTLADSASQAFAATGVATDAMTLADSASNVAALGAVASDALTLAESASNVAALSATATDALTLADTLNATASGDYTAIGLDALTLADSASNVAALSATASDALTLADAASNAAALGAAASDALTLADTLNASASGDYVVTATDALSLSDSVVAAYAAICIATDALTLADATSAAMAGEYAATATDALTLADATSNAAALGVSISEALTLAALVSAMLTGNTALTGKRGGYGVQMQLSARRAQIQTGRCRN